MFIYPLMNIATNQDDTTKILVVAESTQLVDSVRNLGYITQNMYLQFEKKLFLTNNIYSIEIQHFKQKKDPVYKERTINPMLLDFQNSFNSNYNLVTSDVIKKNIFESTEKKHNFKKGDYFLVKVKNLNKTFATRIKELMYNTSLNTEIITFKYGGVISCESN